MPHTALHHLRPLILVFACGLTACSADEYCPGGLVDQGGRCVYPGGDAVFPPIGGDGVVLVLPDASSPDAGGLSDLLETDSDAASSDASDITNTDGSATDTTDGDSAESADSDASLEQGADDAAASDTAAGSETDADSAAPDSTGPAPGDAG